jgi:hypothetical protein
MEKPSMHETQSMEIGLLVILITDHENAYNTALKLINADYRFSIACGKEVSEACYEYISLTRCAPGLDQLLSILGWGPGNPHEIFTKEIRLNSTSGYFQPSYHLERLDRHLRLYELDMKWHELGEAIEQRDADQADQILNQLSAGTANQINPLDLQNPEVLFDFLREDEPAERFHQPIRVLEDMHIHPKRGQVLSIAAGPHQGKSTYLVETVRVNLPARRIAFFSLEPGDQPEVKLMMNQFSLTKRDRKMVRIPHLSRDSGGMVRVSHTEREFDSVKNQRCNLVAQVRERWQNLKLYKIAPGTLTLEKVKQIVVQLDRGGFKVDMIVIDYLDKMKVSKDADHYRLEIIRLCREFSALCAELNVAGVTASQLNKEGSAKKMASMMDQDESIGKAQIGDMIQIFGRLPDERKALIGRISVDKGRGEQSGIRVVLAQQYEIGQFCLDAMVIGSDDDVHVEGSDETKEMQIVTLLDEGMLSMDSIAQRTETVRAYVLQVSRRFCSAE